MKGYFTRKPVDIKEVKAAIGEARRQGREPEEIEVIGKVILTQSDYTAFCNRLLSDREFLVGYADDAVFTEDSAKAVLVGALGQHWVAVSCEGFNYPRYVAWPFQEGDELICDGK